MNALPRKHWPLFSVMGVYWVTMIVLVILSTNLNEGHLIYPLDDTYIHMSIAKNAVLHHVWGVTRYEFTSSTSSPLWTALLAITYLTFGVNEKSPLILNLLFGTLAILVSYLFLTKYINSRLRIFIILLVAVFVTPLPSLTLTGMEHVLHALLSLSFVYLSILTLSTTTKPLQKYYVLLMVLSPLVTTIRYEGVFLVFVVCALFLLQRKVVYAVTLGITALLPLILYGILSIAHGWYFFPNSLLLKGHIPSSNLNGIIKLFGFGALYQIQTNPHILILLTASLSLLLIHYLKREKSCDDMKYANLIFVGSLLLHMYFASMGWFYRYEAYLVLLGIVVISMAVNNLLPKMFVLKINKEAFPFYISAMLLILVIAIPFGFRALQSLRKTPQATHDRFLEHIQPARFIRQYYNNSVVAINDLGAVAYFTDARILDVYGLGSIEPYVFRKDDSGYSKQDVYIWTQSKGTQIAFLQIEWPEVYPRIPHEWEMVGRWKMPQNVVFGNTDVGIYAVAPSGRESLIQNLKQFGTELPVDVKQYGEYVEK